MTYVSKQKRLSFWPVLFYQPISWSYSNLVTLGTEKWLLQDAEVGRIAC